ncbi:hypothetical protein ACI7K7_002924 [Escherichia coli]|nr:Rpn family recombination-promoting nuclease/putative transposase [Escherichia coli]HDH7419063.1 hypothetical protein [Escherichia coli]
MNLPACFRNPDVAAKLYTRAFHLVEMTLQEEDEIM